MKKLHLILVAAAMMFMVACDPVENDIKQLETITSEAQENGDSYGPQQWENQMQAFEDILNDLNDRDLNPDDRNRIANLSGQFAGLVVRYSISNSLNSANEALEGLDAFMEGIGQSLDAGLNLDGLENSLLEGIDDVVDDLDNLMDEIDD